MTDEDPGVVTGQESWPLPQSAQDESCEFCGWPASACTSEPDRCCTDCTHVAACGTPPAVTGQGERGEVLYDEEVVTAARWEADAHAVPDETIRRLFAAGYSRGRADGAAEERAKWKWLGDASVRLAGKYTYAPGPGGNLDRIAQLSAEDLRPAVEEWIKSHYRAMDKARGLDS